VRIAGADGVAVAVGGGAAVAAAEQTVDCGVAAGPAFAAPGVSGQRGVARRPGEQD